MILLGLRYQGHYDPPQALPLRPRNHPAWWDQSGVSLEWGQIPVHLWQLSRIGVRLIQFIYRGILMQWYTYIEMAGNWPSQLTPFTNIQCPYDHALIVGFSDRIKMFILYIFKEFEKSILNWQVSGPSRPRLPCSWLDREPLGPSQPHHHRRGDHGERQEAGRSRLRSGQVNQGSLWVSR